jgi:16S rRNA (adenine1518-N6/adenine1519-N6)-dimethyltransferase
MILLKMNNRDRKPFKNYINQGQFPVRAKKSLGQHFLKDQSVAQKIVAALCEDGSEANVIEIGPGTGVFTQYLIQRPQLNLKVVEIDKEAVGYLLEAYPQISKNLYEADFLKLDLENIFPKDFVVIGNLPYNISSQIFFKILDYRNQIPEVVCMIQKEVAERLAAPSGTKTYGILSVLLQAWYNIEYLFTVGEGAFVPPPKVKSAVIRLRRNGRMELGCDEVLFKKIVKTSFNQRRKTIHNSLKPIWNDLPCIGRGTQNIDIPFLDKRPEQLSVEEFVALTTSLS